MRAGAISQLVNVIFLTWKSRKDFKNFPSTHYKNHPLPPITGFPPFLAKIFYPPY